VTKIRYHIILLNVTESGQVVEIRHRLPSNYGRCTGYVARHVKGIVSEVDIPEIGLVAIEFNSRKQLYLNDLVGYQAQVEQLPEFQELNIPLESGQLVTGFYLDTQKNPDPLIGSQEWFQPYQVAIYLKCELHKGKEHVRPSCIHTVAAETAANPTGTSAVLPN
jgi:hypothetical protein